jgi:predicted DNA-binding transcriptional regulator AlpA
MRTQREASDDPQRVELERRLIKAARELAAYLETEERERSRDCTGASASSSSDGFLSLQEFLREIRLSGTAYRNLRAQGKMPPEIRLSARTIRFSKAEIEKWRAMPGREPGRPWRRTMVAPPMRQSRNGREIVGAKYSLLKLTTDWAVTMGEQQIIVESFGTQSDAESALAQYERGERVRNPKWDAWMVDDEFVFEPDVSGKQLGTVTELDMAQFNVVGRFTQVEFDAMTEEFFREHGHYPDS